MKRIISAVVVLSGLAAPTWAGYEGLAAYQQGDYATAVREWRPLAEKGDAGAQNNLGVMYRDGRGVPQDYVQAHMWFNLAASRAKNGEFLVGAVKNRDTVAGYMTPTQVAEAQRLARAWRPKKHVAATSSRPDAGGAPRKPVAASTPPAPDPARARQRIASVQRGLASLGYNPGPADGVMGRKTRAAISAFQAKAGLPVTGEVSARLEAAVRAAKRIVASARPTPREPVKKRSTGSGFVVSAAGHILTNHHVVKGCRSTLASTAGMAAPAGMLVQPKPDAPAPREEREIFKARGLSVIGVDTANDLALLKSAKSISTIVKFRGGRGVRTGEDIVVAGFPLHGLLTSDINITKGIVSALAGPGDDRRIFQITAPVQPGNSGGPVLDASGHVVCVVVARLDALKMARLTGRLPQNVNFAISEGAARAFLDAHDVPYKTARSDRPMRTVDIAAKAKGYTVLIECWK